MTIASAVGDAGIPFVEDHSKFPDREGCGDRYPDLFFRAQSFRLVRRRPIVKLPLPVGLAQGQRQGAERFTVLGSHGVKNFYDCGTRSRCPCFGGAKNARSKLVMPVPRARHFELRAVEARLAAEQMHDPGTRRAMMNLALRYQRLAKHAAMRETRENPPSGMPHAGAKSGSSGLKF